jgi:hypothetical protein
VKLLLKNEHGEKEKNNNVELLKNKEKQLNNNVHEKNVNECRLLKLDRRQREKMIARIIPN